MQQDLVGLAFAAGLVAALNPCGFALLPAYLALVVRDTAHVSSESDDRSGVVIAVGRALAATAAMALGFLAVFGAFGFLTVSLASTVQRYMPYATVLIGIALVALGIWLLAGRELSLPNRLARNGSWAPTRRLGSMFGYGMGYAIASLSCTVGPFLAVTGAAVGGTSAAGRVLIYVAYAAGFALVVGALAVAIALAGSALVDRMRRILPYVNRIGGAVLILVGLYVGYYGYYEVRLFTAGWKSRGSGDRRGGPTSGRDRRLGAPARVVAVDPGASRVASGRGALVLAPERCYFETDTVPWRSGHGGRRTIASVARVAETSPVNAPTIAMRVLSTAGTQDRLAVFDDEHADRFRGEAKLRVARLGPSSHPGDWDDGHSVHGFVRLPVHLRSGRIRHDRIEGIS